MNCAEPQASFRARDGATPSEDDGLALLPPEWRSQVVAAIDIETHREYEMPASRCFGYDADGSRCFYAHDYAVETTRSDDDEEFYRVVAYGETVRAWRLRDGRWLVYRRLQAGDECEPQRGFFTLADTPPWERR